jgi:hypothetical protein
MFWKKANGFSDIPPSSRVAISAFLIIAGIGYIFGFLTIYTTYSPVDQEKGLSVEDIRLTFWGKRETTTLEKSIDGTMKQYFENDNDYQATKDWIHKGAPEEGWDSQIKPIFDTSCNSCHSKDAEVAGVVTETYADVEQYLQQDTGKSLDRLISLSHTHILALLPVIFILSFIFWFTTYSEGIKTAVVAFSFFAILLDVGSWWLAKLGPGLAFMVIIGGICLALAFLMLILLSLYELWIKSRKEK